MPNPKPQAPPRDPTKWGQHTQGDAEQALDTDNIAKLLLDRIANGKEVSLPFPPSTENKQLVEQLNNLPAFDMQKLFDIMRGNTDIQNLSKSFPVGSQRQYYETMKDK